MGSTYPSPVMEHPVFVMGAPRSGTTLLRYCLNAHSNVYISPETHYFPRIFGKRRLIGSFFGSINPSVLVDRIFHTSGDPSLASLDNQKEALIKSLSEQPPGHTSLFAHIMRYFATHHRADRYGEKTPNHFLYIPLILSWFPHASLLFMQRDPKLVVASYLHNKPDHTYDTRKQALHRISALLKIAKLMRNRYNHRLLTVPYHQLTHQPGKVLKRVCSYVNIPYQKEMLEPGVTNSSYGNEPGFHTGSEYSIEPQNRDKWTRVLSAREARKIENYVEGTGRLSTGKMPANPEMLRIRASYFLSRLGLNPYS